MKNCVAMCILVCVASALPANNLRTEWQKFKKTYGKQYLTTAEEDIRFHTFSRNLKSINEHNKQYELGLATYKMAVNEFTDWTDSEFKKMLGFIPHTELLSTEVDYRQEWDNYKQTYQKSYSEEEDTFRFKVFSESFEKILKHNENYKKGLTTFEMGLNRFSDMTFEEVKKFMGFRGSDLLVMTLGDTHNDCKVSWKQYKEEYGKAFQSNEEGMRFEIFCNNFRIIQKHNEDYEKGLTTYKMEINKFSDRTSEEMKKMMGYMGKNVEVSASRKSDVDDACYEEYADFKKTYSRYFETQSDEARHFNIFCKNIEIIKKHNKDFHSGLTTYEMSVNKFTDMTPEEMNNYFGYMNERAQELYESEWQKFKAMFGKTYKSLEEEQHRYEVFCSNLDAIHKHNKEYEKGMTTFNMAVDEFTDLTYDEFQHLLRDGL